MSSLNHQVNAQIAPRNSSSCVGSESGDYSQSDGYVDSIAAGKSLAISSICRIICSKNSCEVIGDEQLAKFYAALYDALVAKERIVLCTLLHTTTNLFSLGLPGVEILLPNYIMAIDLILTESMQLQLNPSIPQATMRHSCLKALGSVISWPTTFSAQPICTFDINPLGSEGKLLNIHNMVYLDIRVRILQILIHTLRNEIAPNNLCLVLSLCNIFYEECCAFDIQNQKERKNSSNSIKSKLQSQSSINEAYLADEDKLFCRSVVRGIVSAVCDNLCKSQWSSDRSICVSAIECLNAIPALHASIIFDNKDISTASLIVSSLCRFIDNQLMKPPMFHSKDLHSTVVSAYNSLNVWLCACPALTEIETCLKMVAKTIELGLTGGKNLEPENYNPASQRVRDAANCLLEHVFSSVSSSQLQGVVDERRLLLKYGPAIIDTTRFKHFLINNSTLLSIHEATQFSNVLSVFIVIRTPSKPAHANFIQLEGKSREEVKKNEVIESARYVPGSDTVPQCAIINQADLSSRSSSTSTSIHSLVNKLSIDEGGIDGAKNDQLTHDIKQFSFPTDFWQPLCKLDEVPCELTDTPTTEKILRELKQIKDCLDKGQSPIGRRSLENVWLNGGATNKNEVGNEGPASINSIPAFLYSMGLLSEECYQKELVQLDSGQCDRFYKDLHTMVDSSPVRIPQTVSLYYVKRGQRKVGEILANMENIMNLDSTFAYLLSDLGDGIQTKSHPFWTGSWNNSFSSDRKPKNYGNTCDNYSLDGTEYALYWSDNMMEFAFITPTVKSIEMAKNCKNPLLDKTTTSNQTIKKLQYNEIKILVIWVERFEDIELFPIGDLALDQFSNQPVEHIAFYLYSFEEDLIKVTVRETALKLGKPGPLIDEACVSKYSLASLIRTTVFNVSRRYIVEFDK
uniref:Rap-GAP domain-containing protein n=1 Tax=Rhabditophanes sp. KR3021 TaxID=114890 RepID=A0AC35U705_9BILA